ncbi:hypothetical protein KC360_g19 [Hortaea werneckii]|nr:hypothetical protein KC344_g18 [Hortaea werneckii]KAI7180513.1 hypothetical protein KC360_g19 [Hortaea werneckii]
MVAIPIALSLAETLSTVVAAAGVVMTVVDDGDEKPNNFEFIISTGKPFSFPVVLGRHHAEGVGHAELDGLRDTPLETLVDVLLPGDLLEVGLLLVVVEGPDAARRKTYEVVKHRMAPAFCSSEADTAAIAQVSVVGTGLGARLLSSLNAFTYGIATSASKQASCIMPTDSLG